MSPIGKNLSRIAFVIALAVPGLAFAGNPPSAPTNQQQAQKVEEHAKMEKAPAKKARARKAAPKTTPAKPAEKPATK